MRISFDVEAWADYILWQREHGKIFDRINVLIKECIRDTFRGIGKPELLSQNLSGRWSRRIDRKHRLIYRVTGKDEATAIEIAQCRYHY